MTRFYSALCLLLAGLPAAAVAQTIDSFSPASGNVGTLVTLRGTNLNLVTAATVNGTGGVILEKTSTSLRLMVMPGTTTGPVSTTGGTPAASATTFGVTGTALGTAQQGPKLVGTGGFGGSDQGRSVALSADGSTLAVGGNLDNNYNGATWVFVRSGSGWTQQGPKLVGTGATGRANQGWSVALSADGATLAVGGTDDNSSTGATWVFVRSGSGWSQQGPKLVGTGGFGGGDQGRSVALSADGSTLAVGGARDNSSTGATWVFTRTGAGWSQQGPKLVGTGATGTAEQGWAVALSADGATLAVGGAQDNNFTRATWVFTRTGANWSQQGPKLVGTGAGGRRINYGISVALSADGATLAVGGAQDNNFTGATWVFTRTGTGWSQQGPKLVGTGATGAADQGTSVALSADGATLAVSGVQDNNATGATWVFVRTGTGWSQQGPKLVGTGATGQVAQGTSVALAADGSTLAVSGVQDNNLTGATWVFSTASAPLARHAAAGPPPPVSFFPNPVAEQFTITGGASAGLLRLLDGLGRTLFTLPYRQGQPLHLAFLAPGCYWLRVDQGAAQPLFKQ